MELERKIAIIGAAGMLGHSLREAFPNALLLDINASESRVQMVDLASQDSLKEMLAGFGSGDFVVNAAAYTNVDGAETEEGNMISQRVNVEGPTNLARLSSKQDFKVLHFSTGYVFDGQNAPYREEDKTNPPNNYGRHKLLGEYPILDEGGIVLRTDVLFGPHGANFVDTIKKLARGRTKLEVVNDQIGSPTYVDDLAQITKVLLGNNTSNGAIYHTVNRGRCSRAHLAREIINILGLNCEVVDTSTEKYNEKNRSGKATAVRPPDCSLVTPNIVALGYIPRNWQTAVADYLTHTKQF